MVEAEAEAVASVYCFISSWLTPSFLFIFINLVIGTIVITTRFAKPIKHRGERENERVDSPQLSRSPSLLHRLMSFNLSCYQNQSPPSPSLSSSLSPSPTTTLEETEVETQNLDGPIQQGLNRSPSLLERVMSVKFFRSQSIEAEKIEPEPVPGSDICGDVDEKADNFIKRFKEQLRLQRLDSILRYRDMTKGN